MSQAITPQGGPPLGTSGLGQGQGAGVLASWGLAVPRWTWWAIGAFGLMGLAIVSEWLFPSGPVATSETRAGQAKPLSLSGSKTEHEAWLAQAQGEVKALSQQVQQLAQKQDALAQALKSKNDQRVAGLPPAGFPAPPGGAHPVLKTATDGEGLPADPLPPVRDAAPPPPAASSQAQSKPDQSAAPPQSQKGPPVQGPLVAPVKPSGSASASGKLRVVEADARAIPAKYWLPLGTVIPVRLLSGVDAPAGGSGVSSGMASQPHPLLMQVIDLAKLPNDTTMDATGCYALGETLGDISTERAMVRVLGISCVRDDGVSVDVPVKGVITGEDGKVGLRGRMVIRESAMLARTLLTGFVSGVSRAFMPFQFGMFIAPTAGQALEPPPLSNVALSGMAGGMQQAAQMLAQHYAQMAARIYPVIEVDAGRWADLIVTEGRELKETLR